MLCIISLYRSGSLLRQPSPVPCTRSAIDTHTLPIQRTKHNFHILLEKGKRKHISTAPDRGKIKTCLLHAHSERKICVLHARAQWDESRNVEGGGGWGGTLLGFICF